MVRPSYDAAHLARYSSMPISNPSETQHALKLGPQFASGSAEDWKSYNAELIAYQRLTPHPRILPFFGEIRMQDRPCMLLGDSHNTGPQQHLGEYLLAYSHRIKYALRLQWAVEIVEGLVHIHQNRIVWLNMTLDNILLTHNSPNGPHVLLSNFAGSQVQRREPASAIPDPVFLSPKGRGGRSGEGSWKEDQDIFAYGVVLFVLLTLRYPHAQALSLDASIKHQIQQAHSADRYEPLSREDYPVLAEVVEKCFWGRYVSTEALLADVRRGRNECCRRGPPRSAVSRWLRHAGSACVRFPSSPAGMMGISFAAGVAASLAVTRRQELTARLVASWKNALCLLPAVLYPTFTEKLKNFTFKPYYSLVPVALKKSLEESWMARLLLMAAVVEIVTSFPR